MKFTGFCAVAVEDELNSKWEDLGTKTLAFYPYHFNLTTKYLFTIILGQEENCNFLLKIPATTILI